MFHNWIQRLALPGTLLAAVLVLLSACTPPFSTELNYISTVFNHAQRTLSSVNQLQGLAAQPRLGDAAWESQVDTQVNTLRGLIAEARQLTPPQNFTGFHQSYLAQMSNLEQVVTTYDQAVSARNSAVLQQTQQRLQEANAQLERLRQQLEGMRNAQ